MFTKTTCLAKWFYFSLSLPTGRTHSCFHPLPHRINFKSQDFQPHNIHNTPIKTFERNEMLAGRKPVGCAYCWNIETNSSVTHSDRYKFNKEEWALKGFEKHGSLTEVDKVMPTYLEIIVTHKCNLGCAYCAPSISSTLLAEFNEHGPYMTTPMHHMADTFVLPTDDLKTKTFKELKAWWPELSKNLMFLKISGGEPLIDDYTFEILDLIETHPQPELRLQIISNLSVPEARIRKFRNHVSALIDSGKIAGLDLFCSLDNLGSKAEYIRANLNTTTFFKNLSSFLLEKRKINVSIINTFSIFSLVGLSSFVKKIFHLEDESSARIPLDFPPLTEPSFMSIAVAPLTLLKELSLATELYKERERRTTYSYENEILCLERAQTIIQKSLSSSELRNQRSNFYAFFEEYGKRKNMQLLDSFPELSSFWQDCREEYSRLTAVSNDFINSLASLIPSDKFGFASLDGLTVEAMRFDNRGRLTVEGFPPLRNFGNYLAQNPEKREEMLRFFFKRLSLINLFVDWSKSEFSEVTFRGADSKNVLSGTFRSEFFFSLPPSSFLLDDQNFKFYLVAPVIYFWKFP